MKKILKIKFLKNLQAENNEKINFKNCIFTIFPINLRNLNISYCKYNNDMLKFILKFKKLWNLNISNFYKLNNFVLDFDFKSKFEFLKNLNISGLIISKNTIRSILRLKFIKKLDLTYAKFDFIFDSNDKFHNNSLRKPNL